jgi:hypothetical protein
LRIEIIGAESLGVRSLCCLVTTPGRRILVDPGLSIGYVRHGLFPHPLQVVVGRATRTRILHALNAATDVVISHFHGDHVPLADANPYQLSMGDLPHRRRRPRCWSKSDDDLSEDLRQRRADLLTYFVNGTHAAEGCSHGVQPVARARYAASGMLKSGSLAAYPG